MGVVVMIGSVNFVLYIPLLLWGYVELAPTAKGILESSPNNFILGMMRKQIV